MGRAANDPELQLGDDMFTGVLDFVKRTREEGRIICNYACEGYLGPYEKEVRDLYFYCRAGVEVASVLCDGSISLYRDRSWARKGQCAKCKVWRYCEGNGLHLYDDNGDLLSCSLHRIV